MLGSLNSDSIDTVVVGAGQAGLATSYHLKKRGLEHVVLDENERAGAAWRARWKSLRLFTPGSYNSLPGLRYDGAAHIRPAKDEIADYLERYAANFQLPIIGNVKVTRLSAANGQYLVEAGQERLWARNVVVATGPFHKARLPGFASELDAGIFQLHARDYQEPGQVPQGPALVVGAGQSGAEIAVDLAADRSVWLSGQDPGEEPAAEPGSLKDRIITPVMAFAATRVVNVANPIGRKMRDHYTNPPRGIPRAGGTGKRIRQSGIQWVGRTVGAHEGRPQIDDGRVLEVVSVIWCTGFRPDYDWIELPVFDDYGYPAHSSGVVKSQPGLYFVGLMFQRTLASSLIMGVGKDAEHVVKHIAGRRQGGAA